MKVIFLFVILFSLSVSNSANGASLPESDLELQLLRAPSTSLVVHSRNRRAIDVYDFTRYLIANLIDDLQNAVTAVSNAVRNLTSTIEGQRDQFLANLNSSVQDIITQVETVIENVVNITQALTGAISLCVDENRSAAQTLVETTVTNLSGCLNNTLTGINSILKDARNLADSALSLAQNISAEVPNCGTANWSNFVQVGSCLNQILRDQQPAVDTLVNKITYAVVNAGVVVTGIPTNLVICSGTSIAQAGFTGLQIAQNIRTCAGNVLGG